MTEYDNTNRGAIFENTNKKTDKHPDRTGSLNVGGTDYWVSGWLKTSQGGKRYMSLSVTPKEPEQPVQQSAPAQDDFDDDIPF